MTDFEDWLRSATNGASDRSIANALGVANTALSRWKRENQVPADRVIAIARLYGARVFDGLQAAGYLTADDIRADMSAADLSGRNSLELLDELRRREILQAETSGMPVTEIEFLVDRIVEERLARSSRNDQSPPPTQ